MSPPSYEVAIVGGGIAGQTLAYELAKREARVALIEREAEPTAVPVALLNPHRGRTARAREADLAGLEAFWHLAAELGDAGIDHGARRTGVLRVASDARQARSWRTVVAGSKDTSWLETEDVPGAVNAPFGAMLVERGGLVDTRRLRGALWEAAETHGATVHSGLSATGLATGTAALDVTVSGLQGPDRLTARHVVLCIGATPPPDGCRLPSLQREGGIGAVLVLPEHSDLEEVPPVSGPVNAAFLPGRVVVTGGSLSAHRPPAEALRESARGLRDALSWSVPPVAELELADVWFGVRARRPSGVPVVRRLAPRVTYYGGLAGRGYLCAADLSRKLADRLMAVL